MFMEDVVAKIWEPVSREYADTYRRVMELTGDELYREIIKEMDDVEFVSLQNEWLAMTNLAVTGCQHCIKNGRFSGCSFCDYYSAHATGIAKLAALKQKDPQYYAKVVYRSFENSRSGSAGPAVVEYISGHDTLNPDVITDDIYEEFQNNNKVFKQKSLYCFFETRASNITVERLQRWREKIGHKISSRIVVEFGMEVGNEWVRNHWLNKNITNREIFKAIGEIRKARYYSGTSILIGIPGLTDRQSLELFRETYCALHDAGTDFIICLPLVRKKYTLQDFLYNEMQHDPALIDLGIACGAQTGMPSVFTLFQAIFTVIQDRPESAKKIILGPVYFPPYFEAMNNIYRGTEMEPYVRKINVGLDKFGKDKDFAILQDLMNSLQHEKMYQEYQASLKKQPGLRDLERTIRVAGEAFAQKIWPSDWRNKCNGLYEELSSYRPGVSMERED